MGQAAYDLAPALRLMLMGIAIAAGPLLWVWLRTRRASLAQQLRALTLLTLFLTFDLVLFGAFTRLTDSGLGCPDWPGCYGKASPLGAAQEIASAQAAMPSGPVSKLKAWIEMLHRYLATGVGVLILTLAAVSWLGARREPGASPVSPWWPTVALAWVCVQGGFGALTVTMRLFPLIVTLHLLGGLILLGLLGALALRYDNWQRNQLRLPVSMTLRRAILLCAALLLAQVSVGAWVSTNYAVLACPDFPTCQGRWWPVMDFSQGFQLWRELGLTSTGAYISFPALTAIHFTHRLLALPLALSLLGLALVLYSVQPMRARAAALAGLVALQVATGVSNVVFGWPLLAAILHTGGAAALWLLLTWIWGSTCGVKPQTVASAAFGAGEKS